MAEFQGDLDDLGKRIQDIVDKAVSSQDYQKLNQTVRQAVDRAVDYGSVTNIGSYFKVGRAHFRGLTNWQAV